MRAAAIAIVLTLTASIARAQDAPAGIEAPAHHGSHGQGDSSAQVREESPPPNDHAGHAAQDASRPSWLPAITEADRAAAFPDVHGHGVHDNAITSFVLFDQLEWQTGTGPDSAVWDVKGWIGRDRDRIWFRTEGAGSDDESAAQAHVMYGRAIARWWDLVAGVRHDTGTGPDRTWGAIGVQGLAPYRFNVEATAYVGEDWRTHVRLETEYELLLTNRLVLQPLVELDVYGKSDPERGIGAGLSSGDAGLRLRYEIRRELAPYAGVEWSRRFFGTADLARAQGEPNAHTRFVLGARVWF